MSIDLGDATDQVEAMVQGFVTRLPYLVIALVVFGVGLLMGRIARALVRRFTRKEGKHHNLSVVLGRVLQVCVVMLGLLVALTIALPGFTPGKLVEILGVGSVAVGFAFKDVLQNFLAGILILLTEPFQIDDQIIVGDFEGTVEDIQTRATYIRTYDGRRVVIPNADLFTDSVTVNTAYPKRRVEVDFGIGYGDDIVKAKEVTLAALEALEETADDPPPEVLVTGFGESSIDLRMRWWIDPPRRKDVLVSRDAALTAVKAALSAAGIDLPFPTRQILFHDQTEPSDGDRSRQREGWPAAGDADGAAAATATRQDGASNARQGGGTIMNEPDPAES
jgi:small conductance mechanosensitive channel